MAVDETLRTIAWAVVALAGIQGLTVYTVVRLLVTGRALFERRETHEPTRRVIGLGDR